MENVHIAAMVIGLLAAYPGWLLCQKAYFTSRWPKLCVVGCLLLTAGLATLAFYLPFRVAAGAEVAALDMFTDFIMLAVCPVGLLAFIAYVMDHLSESPLRASLAGAACFAIALLPILYYLYGGQMLAAMEITIKS